MKVAFSRYSRAAVKAKIFSFKRVLYLTSLDYLCELKVSNCTQNMLTSGAKLIPKCKSLILYINVT